MQEKHSSSTTSVYIFDTKDPYGKRVFLEKARFEEHILDHHPEMKGNELAMKETVEDPHLIIQSKQNPNRWLYVGKSDMATYPLLNIKTVVDHTSTEYGYVVTGLFQKKINAEKEGTVIYERTSENSLR